MDIICDGFFTTSSEMCVFSRYQQRLSYDLLTGLASSLLDGQVFEIVTGLKEVQHLEEHHLSTQRMKMIHEHKGRHHPTVSYPIFFHLPYFNSHFQPFPHFLRASFLTFSIFLNYLILTNSQRL